MSILPPTAINSIDSDGYWEAMRPPGTSPLLVFVNTKSGDNQVRNLYVCLLVCLLDPYLTNGFSHYYQVFAVSLLSF